MFTVVADKDRDCKYFIFGDRCLMFGLLGFTGHTGWDLQAIQAIEV